MIRLLQGTVYDRDERSMILLVNGVGYQVTLPARTLANTGAAFTAFIHTHVREDILALYGFATRTELQFFELLITVNGVGPKMAMEILNEPVEVVQNALFTGNLPALTRVPGIGKKLAERLILELKGKVEPALSSSGTPTPSTSSLDEDAVTALETLGYKRHHIERVLGGLKIQEKGTEELIRTFLQRV